MGSSLWVGKKGEMSRFFEACKLLSLFGVAGVLGLSSTAAISAQKHTEQQMVPRFQDLHIGNVMTLNAAAPTVAAFGSKCDENGGIYLSYSSAAPVLSTGAIDQFPVAKISIGSEEMIQYPVPVRVPWDQGQVIRLSFDVSADGTLYALFNTAHRNLDGKMTPEFLIAKYNDDGTIDSYIHIGQVPGRAIQPLRIAVFGNGDFLLSGTTVLKEGLRSFTGLFGEDGNVIHLMKLGKPLMDPWDSSGEGDKDAHESTQPVSEVKTLKDEANNPVSLESSTLNFSGRDGNLYLLQGTEDANLYVISSMGEVLRHFKLPPPHPGLSPLQMAQAGPGFLFIYYGHLSKGTPNEKIDQRDMITVINTANGEVTANYRMPESHGAVLPACAVSPQEFVFIGATKNNKLALVPYSAQ